jgi:hypothetical protein
MIDNIFLILYFGGKLSVLNFAKGSNKNVVRGSIMLEVQNQDNFFAK